MKGIHEFKREDLEGIRGLCGKFKRDSLIESTEMQVIVEAMIVHVLGEVSFNRIFVGVAFYLELLS